MITSRADAALSMEQARATKAVRTILKLERVMEKVLRVISGLALMR